MAATLESVQSLLLQVLGNQQREQSDRQRVEAKLDQVLSQLSALQVAQASAPARKPRSSGASATHVGTDAATGQASQVPKFPNNTVLWVKEKASNDADFLPRKMTPGNYAAMEAKHADKLKEITSEGDRRKRLAELIWKELNDLSDKSGHVETKEFATKLLDHLRKEWKEEKLAHEAAHPKVAPATAATTNGVLVPDLPVLSQPLLQMPNMTLPVTSNDLTSASSLVTPFNLSLSLVSPTSLPSH